MPNVRVENSPGPDRRRAISSWPEGEISSLSSREKKRYNKNKSAIKEYFTTNAVLDKIAHRHHLSATMLLNLAEKCLMQHADGRPWGFRALLPGVKVIDNPPSPAPQEVVLPNEDAVDPAKERSNDAVRSAANSSTAEREGSTTLVDEADDDTAKRQAIKLPLVRLPLLAPSRDTHVPETPLPPFMSDEDEEVPVEEMSEVPAEEEESGGKSGKVTVQPEPAAEGLPAANEAPQEGRGIQEQRGHLRY